LIHKNSDSKAVFGIRIRIDLLISLLLVGATLAIYYQLRHYSFINFDDDVYVANNPFIKSGLKIQNLQWAITATRASNWHPLTWVSHMLDVHLYGMDPGMHHLTNLFIHILNTLLLFYVLRRMTGALWPSGCVAALFALHPLNVESVAWISERKNLLCTLFWILTLWSYIRYAEHPRISSYLPVLLFYILGLLAKPMLVTLPFVLILLDFWPLNRLPSSASIFYLFKEKIPLFILSAVSSIVTFLVQQKGGAIGSWETYALDVRIANALVSYIVYLGKIIWPLHLAFFYPHPGMHPWWKITGAAVLLTAIMLFVISRGRRKPYLAVGWFWYVGTLVPVIGIVQVGQQAMADRYMYVSLIGVFIIMAWGIPDLLTRWYHGGKAYAVSAAALLSFLAVISWHQSKFWSDSITLFEHAIRVTRNNFIAHNNLGATLVKKGRTTEAISHFNEALRIDSHYAYAHSNLGIALAKQGRMDEAMDAYVEAIRIKPDFSGAHFNMANALSAQGLIDESIEHYQTALRFDPNDSETHGNLGKVLYEKGRVADAIHHYSEACRLNSDNAIARNNYGVALVQMGKIKKAIPLFIKALEIKPNYAEAQNNLGVAYKKQGRMTEAVSRFQAALRIDPDYVDAKNNLEKVLTIQRETDAVRETLETSLKQHPKDPVLHFKLGSLYRQRQQWDRAINHYQAALSIRPEFVPALNGLATVYAIKGDYDTALSLFQEITAVSPNDVDACYKIAAIYARKRQTDTAIGWLKKAVGAGFNDWRRLETDQNMEHIRNSPYVHSLIKNQNSNLDQKHES